MRATFTVFFAALTLSLSAAPAAASNCLGEPEIKPLMRHTVGLKYGDWGLEHQMKVGVCFPLIKGKGRLTDLSFIEAGFASWVTPIYAMPGGYVAIAPLSFLKFHFEAAPVFYWPIGVDAAGYYPLDTLQSDYTKASLSGDKGETALGGFIRFGPTLQLAFNLSPNVRLIIVDTLRIEHFVIGTAPVYFHNRNDLPATNPDWFLENVGIVMVGIKVHPNAELRLGVNDALVMNFSAGQKSNSVRGIGMISMKRVGRLRDLTPILTVGIRTNHPVRQWHFTFIAAISFAIDLSKPSEEAEG
jgi:hypothetical protein